MGEKWIAFVNLWHFFLGIALSIPLLALPWVLRDRSYWLPVAMVTAGWAALLMTTWANPRYLPQPRRPCCCWSSKGFATCVFERRRRKQPPASVPSPSGRGWGEGRARPESCVACVHPWRRASRRLRLVRALVLAQLIGFVPYAWFHVRQPAGEFASRRAELVRRLQASPGRHLVIVRYGSDYNIHQEWVYNGADIDAARIVWARQMNPAADRQLVEYFRDRHVWLLRADETPPRLVPYEEATQPDS